MRKSLVLLLALATLLSVPYTAYSSTGEERSCCENCRCGESCCCESCHCCDQTYVPRIARLEIPFTFSNNVTLILDNGAAFEASPFADPITHWLAGQSVKVVRGECGNYDIDVINIDLGERVAVRRLEDRELAPWFTPYGNGLWCPCILNAVPKEPGDY